MMGRGVTSSESIFLAIIVIIFVASCDVSRSDKVPRVELLVYCGITMIKPVHELAQKFEEMRNCHIKIVKGGSGDLLKSLKANGKGDLFLPGESSYMESCVSDGVCGKFVCVGYNRPTMVVKKNNPKNIPAELKSLTNPSYRVALANPETGSIGLEARTVLEKAGLFRETMANSPIFTTDSKDITRAVKEGVADVGVNWYATTQWPENSSQIDSLDISEEYAPKTPLLLGILKYSSNSDLAMEFINFAVSAEGRDVFQKYGFEPSN